jgi:hypothetical protein
MAAPRPTPGRDHLNRLRASRDQQRAKPFSGLGYDPAAKPDWEQRSTGGYTNVNPYVRETLGIKGRELGKVMRAYNQQYRREPIQEFVNPDLLKKMGLYNPYAPNNPGGKPRGAGHW